MVKRIVKMTFDPKHSKDFEELFDTYRAHIRNQPGCLSLEMLRAVEPTGVYFTYSTWEDSSWLETYRKSATFAEVWPLTRAMFAAPAEAWTVEVCHNL